MPCTLKDPSFLYKVVAGGGCAPQDIPSDAAVEFTDPAGEQTFVVFYPFDRGEVRSLLASARGIIWHYASANFQRLFPEFFPTTAVA